MTLTGEPNLVAIAEGYLKQIDLRKRQVAVRLQILDVDLLNQKEFDNSFALGREILLLLMIKGVCLLILVI